METNIKSAFADEDFADVTLACEDGHQVLVKKEVLASSSLLQRMENKLED